MDDTGTLNERIKRIERALETSGLWEESSTVLRAHGDSEELVHHEIIVAVEELRASLDDLDHRLASVRSRVDRLEEEIRPPPLD